MSNYLRKQNKWLIYGGIFIMFFWVIILISPVHAIEYTSQYPTQDASHVKATTYHSGTYLPHFTTNPASSLTGLEANNQWYSLNGDLTNQRFHIDLVNSVVIERIYYENSHSEAGGTTRGAKDFTFWGSNSATSFDELTYGTDTGWTLLTVSQNTFDEHSAIDESDPKYILVTNSNSYRYYGFKIANNYGGANFIGMRRIELQTENLPISPTSAFNCSPLSLYPYNSTFCIDESNETPTIWLWDMGWGNISTTQNVTHQYNIEGNYTVSLRAENDGGYDWENKTDFIFVMPLPTSIPTPTPIPIVENCSINIENITQTNIVLNLSQMFINDSFIEHIYIDGISLGSSIGGIDIIEIDEYSPFVILSKLNCDEYHYVKIDTNSSICGIKIKTSLCSDNNQDLFFKFLNQWILVILVLIIFAIAIMTDSILGFIGLVVAFIGLMTSINYSFWYGIIFLILMIVGIIIGMKDI